MLDNLTLLKTAEGIELLIADEIASGLQKAEKLHVRDAQNVGSGAKKAGQAVKKTGAAARGPAKSTAQQATRAPNIVSVANMKQFFNETRFGKQLKSFAEKTSHQHKGQSIYRLSNKIKKYGLDRSDLFYLDSLHFDHIEVFRKNGKIKAVLNLDGTINRVKTQLAISQGRRIPT